MTAAWARHGGPGPCCGGSSGDSLAALVTGDDAVECRPKRVELVWGGGEHELARHLGPDGEDRAAHARLAILRIVRQKAHGRLPGHGFILPTVGAHLQI